jgi:hypothetical protein
MAANFLLSEGPVKAIHWPPCQKIVRAASAVEGNFQTAAGQGRLVTVQ